MRSNPIFNYLHFLVTNETYPFEILKRHSRSGKLYFLIPLTTTIPELEHAQYGRFNIIDMHLTAFPEISTESHESVIHLTVHMCSESDEIKFHVYQDIDGNVVGFYVKDMKNPEKIPNITFSDIQSIYSESSPLLATIRHKYRQLCQQLEANVSKQSLKLQNLRIVEESELELHLEQLQELSQSMRILAILNPEEYLSQFEALVQLKEELIQRIHAQKEFDQLHREPVVVESGAGIFTQHIKKLKTKSPIERLVSVRDKLAVLEKLLDQKTEKIEILPNKTLVIHTEYQTKFFDITELVSSYYEDMLSLEGEELTATDHRFFATMNKKIDAIQLKITDFYNEYFNSMVIANNFEHFDLIFTFLNRPSPSVILHLLRHQAADVLVRLLKKFEVSVTEPIFQSEPHSILEHVIHHKNEQCFTHLVSNIAIDFLSELPDGRPLATLILDLNTANRMRLYCFTKLDQFNSKTFFSRLKNRLFELIQGRHPQSRQLFEIYKILDIIKSSGETRPLKSQKPSHKMHESHKSFFDSFTEDLEGMDFLKTERFLLLIQKYERLALKQERRASVMRRTTQGVKSRSEFLNQFCSEDMKQRLKTLMVGLSEDDAYDAMTIAYEVAFANDRIIEIEDELQKSSLSLRAVKGLLQEKRNLKLRIEDLQIGPIASREVSIPSAAKAIVLSQLPEAEQIRAMSIFSRDLPERPIEYYAGLEGMAPSHIESMLQLRASINAYTQAASKLGIEAVIAALDNLHQQFTASDLPEQTLNELTDFYHEAMTKILSTR